MNLNIRGDKIELTDSIKNYVKEKIGKLNKYFENPSSINAHVLIRVRNGKETIEVTIPSNKFTLRAEESNEDLYAAIDLVIDVLERQIRKNKTKLIKHRETALLDFSVEEEVEEELNKIVKRKTISSKPMSEEEAMLQMELLGHDFFVFKNVDMECVSVLYKRKDGCYGIINSK